MTPPMRRSRAWTICAFLSKSIHSGPPPCQESCRGWSAACRWSTACLWETSWWGCSMGQPSLWDWRAGPGECAGTSAWTCTHTGLSSSWLCSAWARWSSPSRKPQSPPWAGSGSSGTRWSARRSPDPGSASSVWWSRELSPPGTAAGDQGWGKKEREGREK